MYSWLGSSSRLRESGQEGLWFRVPSIMSSVPTLIAVMETVSMAYPTGGPTPQASSRRGTAP